MTSHPDMAVPAASSCGAPLTTALGPDTIESLNQGCLCISLDHSRLIGELQHDLGALQLPQDILDTHPHLFAPMAVFVSRHHLQIMADVIAAIDQVTQLPAWRERVLQWAPAIAQHTPGPRGGLLGIDFHLGPSGPQVIEINTNPGGMLLNAALCRAQKACCGEMTLLVAGPHDAQAASEALWQLFENEWRRQRGNAPLRSIAIVDENPEAQYLYPEFRLFQRLFERHHCNAVIAAPAALTWREGLLWHGDMQIDLVYNRLTDFALEAPGNAALREAYLANQVVLTPHPQAHALYADKRNLSLLSDAAALQAMGVDPALASTLVAAVPRTEIVGADNAVQLWERRRELFFKPAGGYGSKAAYRGEKLTRRVWDEIVSGNYVAQALVRPSERLIGTADAPQSLKLDLRSYAYEGRIFLTAARTYQGQTTNFRTPGGGFAPVFTEASYLTPLFTGAADPAQTPSGDVAETAAAADARPARTAESHPAPPDCHGCRNKS